MFKKLLAIFIVLLFLITSISVISAADDSNTISVKVLWEDDIAEVPDEVVVNLLKDGKIVDSAKLNDTNSWNTTFEVDDDGNYEVEEVISDDYSTEITGNAKEGFTVKNALVKEDVLGAVADEDSLGESSADDNLSQSEDDLASAGDNSLLGDNSTGNGTSNSSTNSSTNNSTNNSTVIATNDDDNDTDSNDDDDDSDEKTTTTITTTTTTKKVTKQDDKKPENTTETKNNNTGFPIIVLVIAVFAAVLIPLSRKK